MPKPKKYTYRLQVQEADLDELLHVNNIIYLRYLQEAAIAHWYAIAPKAIQENTRWVVKSHQINYHKSAHMDDQLTISTWIEHFTAVTSLRKYEIKRGEETLVTAETLWIALDTKTLKPKRLEQATIDLFFEI